VDCRTGRVSSSSDSGAVTVGTAGAAGFGGALGVCDGLGVKKLEIVCCLLLCDNPCEDWLLLGAMAIVRGVDGKLRLARVVTRVTDATRSRSHVGRHFRTRKATTTKHHDRIESTSIMKAPLHRTREVSLVCLLQEAIVPIVLWGSPCRLLQHDQASLASR
jgi:hypothetical protein